MRKVFADTLYWIATVKPDDPYEAAAREARQEVGPCIIVTTDEVQPDRLLLHERDGRGGD